ncbi:hypothetical protein B0H14DRAFT_2631437 [Mycena olivaceomarginata]|nr:hypothetical protein B0H14DRAFT_2631437 [Mycena olivaceomarginata]
MDDIQLVASVAAGDLLALRDSLLSPSIPKNHTSKPTIDLTSPARPIVWTYHVENHTEIIETLCSDDEMEVKASLWPSGASSDPPDPSDSLYHNNSDDKPEDLTSVALSTTFWGEANIISQSGSNQLTGQGRACRFNYVDNNPGGTEFRFDADGELDWFFANMSQGGGDFTTASSQFDWNTKEPNSLNPSSSTGTRGINFEGWDTDIVFTEAELPILSPPPVYCSPSNLTSSHQSLEH